MKSLDQILKIRAVVLYVLAAFPEGLDYIKLFKILYFAQRKHLAEYGQVIIQDSFQARQFGPVSGFVRKGLKLIETGQRLPDDFNVFGNGITVSDTTRHQTITSSAKPDLDELSGSDIRCLDTYIDKFRDMQSVEISELSHSDRAWQKAYARAKNDPQLRVMTIMEIAQAGGASTNTLAYIKDNLEIDQALN